MSDFKFRKKFIEQLSDLIDGGINLLEAIKILSNSFKKNERARIIKLKKSLESGNDFEKAFSNISKDKEFLIFVKTAEKTGNISRSLKILKDKYEFMSKIKMEVLSILVYPIIVVITAITILLILLTVVVPKFIEIYNDLDQELPRITQIVINISNVLNGYKFHIMILLLLLTLSIFMIFRFMEDFKNKILMKLPFYKEFLILSFTQSMYAAFASKIEFLDALKLCMDTNNNVFKKELKRIYKKVEKGEYVSSVFSKAKFFTNEYKSYLLIADTTGELEETFKTLSTILNNRLRYKIKIYLKFLEPISILIIAFFVGMIVLSIMLPLFNLGEAIK